jgi:hypothetical protein
MRKLILFLSTLLLCCCSLRKKDTSSLTYDSLSVKQLQTRDSLSHEIQLELQHTENRYIEFYATAPYHWHPDSGLAGGAGYLRVKMSRQSFAAAKQLETEQKKSLKLDKGIGKINVVEKSKIAAGRPVSFKIYLLLGVVGVIVLLGLWVKRKVCW